MRKLSIAAFAVRPALWLAAIVAVGLLWEYDAVAQTTVTIPAAALESQAAADATSDAGHTGRIGKHSVLDMLRAGGILMVPLFICSFVMLIFIFEKFISLRRRRVIPTPFVKRLLEQIRAGQLDREQALACCEENPSHVAKVFGAALLKWGRPAVEVEQAILDSGERASNVLRRYLRVINGVATVSPLLGLLGTTMGIMTAFNEISDSDAMGRPELLAGGIGEALITTASGLFVAIPAIVFYMYFTGRVDQLIIEIDSLGQELVNLISAEAIQDRANAKPKRKLAA